MRVIGITPINNDLKEEKSMKFLQKLGKALMLPVAVLPICGILMGIGYMLCPETMQGGDIQGAANMIGLFLVKAGGALIDNMAILFVIGVGVGMSDKNDGTGGIAALASWLMMTTLLSTKFVTVIIPSIADSATKTLAFNKIENPFIGILAGIIGAIITNAAFNKAELNKIASMARNAYARCINPVGTMADGDTIYAASTAKRGGNGEAVRVDINFAGTLAARVMSAAIKNAVMNSKISDEEFLSMVK